MTDTDIAADAAAEPAPRQASIALSAAEAAELLRQDYREPDRLEPADHPVLTIGGVSARIVTPPGHELPVLLIRGTDDRSDWRLWNLLFRPMLQIGDGDTRTFARGFLRHAERIYGFAKGWLEAGRYLDHSFGHSVSRVGDSIGKLGGIYGHSLGGTAVQIICPSLKIHGISFGSPAPLFDTRQPVGAEYVTNHILTDDWVTRVPIFWPTPPWRFRFVGEVIRHEGSHVRKLAERHCIERYRDAVK